MTNVYTIVPLLGESWIDYAARHCRAERCDVKVTKNLQYHRLCSLSDQLNELLVLASKMQDDEPEAKELMHIVGGLEKIKVQLDGYEEARSQWDQNYDPIG